MEFDLAWILLGLPLAFVLGWLASRFALRQLRAENRRAPKAYFKALNFLLNEQQDQAIDAFIEAVQNDPDTSELHFALGNLFRRRGEYARAVRVHEHLLSRGDLSRADRERAQHALALDFLKAGLLDRAEDALHRLEGTPFEAQARPALPAICERSRGWPQAAAIARRMHAADQGDFSTRQAHYLCEQALALSAQGDMPGAQALLEQAVAAAPGAARARIELARLQGRFGQPAAVLVTLKALGERNPAALPLAAPLLLEAASATGRRPEVQALLQTHYAQTPSLDVLEAIVAMEAGDEGSRGGNVMCSIWSANARWSLPPAGWPPRGSNMNNSTPRYSAPSIMPSSRLCATAAPPAASRRGSIFGNAPAASPGTAPRPAASKSFETGGGNR